jgi:hypothetical protein
MSSLGKPGNPAWVKGICQNPGGLKQHLVLKAQSYCEKGLEVLARMIEDEGERPDIRLAAIKLMLDRGMGLPKVHTDDDEKKVVTPRLASDEELRKRIAHIEGVEKNLNVIDIRAEEVK